MKRNILNLLKCTIASVAFLGTFGANAQLQIPNSSFENWDSLGTTFEEPVNWNSFMSANCTMPAFFCGFGQAQQVWRSNQAHSGNYSALVVSRNAIITNANGNLTLGRINMGSPTAADTSNFNYTDVSDTNFNQKFTGKPDSLVFWV